MIIEKGKYLLNWWLSMSSFGHMSGLEHSRKNRCLVMIKNNKNTAKVVH